MDAAIYAQIEQFVHNNIDSFHNNRLAAIKRIQLTNVLTTKNPYLFRAKNLTRAADLVTALLDARLSSSEEGSFGGFLESLAVFVAQITGGGQKSGIQGIDIELTRDQIRYLIAVKSGQNWGNRAQHEELRRNFRSAVRVIRQNRDARDTGVIQPVEGMCYGKFGVRSADRGLIDRGDYLRMIGQRFWFLISGDKELYASLIEPLGHEAEQHALKFTAEKDATYNRLTQEFIQQFCDADFNIDWPRLVRFVSENMPPDERPLEQLPQ
jgi:hypothetical protein